MTEQKSPAELAAEASSEDTRSFVRRVKRATRRKYTPEEKVRIVLEGFRGEIGISALCRRHALALPPPFFMVSHCRSAVGPLGQEAGDRRRPPWVRGNRHFRHYCHFRIWEAVTVR